MWLSWVICRWNFLQAVKNTCDLFKCTNVESFWLVWCYVSERLLTDGCKVHSLVWTKVVCSERKWNLKFQSWSEWWRETLGAGHPKQARMWQTNQPPIVGIQVVCNEKAGRQAGRQWEWVTCGKSKSGSMMLRPMSGDNNTESPAFVSWHVFTTYNYYCYNNTIMGWIPMLLLLVEVPTWFIHHIWCLLLGHTHTHTQDAKVP
jgi:hypothetical protein